MDLQFLQQKLQKRRQENRFRSLQVNPGFTDFCSNDYLGIAHNRILNEFAVDSDKTGSSGSRLLSGNYPLIEEAEELIAGFHQADAALIFNSGYDANLALVSSMADKTDTILYDELSHASIRDGLRLSRAKSLPFRHNDLADLHQKLARSSGRSYVITESVFSMDGHLAPLVELAELCQKFNAYLIVDEAHATGVIGNKGEGLVQHLGLTKYCFARIHTFGKALGTHGAVILGDALLKQYLINYGRPLIYSTSLPETTIRSVMAAYQVFPAMTEARTMLSQLVKRFQNSDLPFEILKSSTPIQGLICGGAEKTKSIARQIMDEKIDVRPILSPTVPAGKERLRIVLHSFNTMNELELLLNILKKAT